MLQKWQQTAALLLSKDDLNTPVIFVKDANAANSVSEKKEIENIMKKTLIDDIKSFINKNEYCTVLMYVAHGNIYDVYRDEFLGNIFINFYWEQITESDGIRLKITKYDGKQKTLIMIKK